MYIPFEDLGDNSRVWLFQSVSAINEQQKSVIENIAKVFCDSWNSHGTPLSASFETIGDHFLVFAVDEAVSSASGCSIDKSVHCVKEIEEKTGLSLLDRSVVAIQTATELTFYSLAEFRAKVKSGNLEPSDYIYDLSVTELSKLKSAWPVLIKDSWASVLLPKQAII